ncbi:hypothetical protein HHI36_022062, partial [Cryptolaemus montrouzieri]
RFRNAIKSVKTYSRADVGSDYNSVVAKIRIKLKKINNHLKERRTNLEALRDIDKKILMTRRRNGEMQNLNRIAGYFENDQMWMKIGDKARNIAKEVLGKKNGRKREEWMTDEILQLDGEEKTTKQQQNRIQQQQ